MRTVAVANFKGGTGKSTSAGFLAHAFAWLGYRVAVVDTDPDQATLTRWAERGWSLPVKHLLHAAAGQIGGYVDESRYDVVVVDTPPMELRRKVTVAVLGQADDVVIPLRPTFSDWDALPQMWPALDEAGVNPDRVSVLFTGTRAKVSTRTYRELLDEQGRYALRVAVPELEHYAQAMAGSVEITGSDYYVLAAEEITKRGDWT